jgi:hypothetical protein
MKKLITLALLLVGGFFLNASNAAPAQPCVINTVASTSYTLVASDANACIEASYLTTITIPTNASVPFPIGTKIFIQQNVNPSSGTQSTTITPAGGVTLNYFFNGTVSLVTGAVWGSVTIRKTATDTWVLDTNNALRPNFASLHTLGSPSGELVPQCLGATGDSMCTHPFDFWSGPGTVDGHLYAVSDFLHWDVASQAGVDVGFLDTSVGATSYTNLSLSNCASVGVCGLQLGTNSASFNNPSYLPDGYLYGTLPLTASNYLITTTAEPLYIGSNFSNMLSFSADNTTVKLSTWNANAGTQDNFLTAVNAATVVTTTLGDNANAASVTNIVGGSVAKTQANGVPILTGYTGTTGSIGGASLAAGACSSGTVSITGAASGMAAVATPGTYPGDGNYWLAYVSAANTVTVKICAAVAGTPGASTYNVRVLQ